MKRISQTVIQSDCYYTITASCGKVVEAASSENGSAIQLAPYTHKPSQEWAFLRVGEGVYRIKNRAFEKMMDLVMAGTADGTWLHQWEDANCSSQMWIVEPTNNGRVKLKCQLASGKCVDVVGMSTETGTRLQIWQDVNGENQTWLLAEATEKKARKAAAAKPAAKADKPAVKAEAAPKTAKPAKAKKPAAAKASKPAAPKAEAKPAAPKVEAKPAAPKAEAKPAAPKAKVKKA